MSLRVTLQKLKFFHLLEGRLGGVLPTMFPSSWSCPLELILLCKLSYQQTKPTLFGKLQPTWVTQDHDVPWTTSNLRRVWITNNGQIDLRSFVRLTYLDFCQEPSLRPPEAFLYDKYIANTTAFFSLNRQNLWVDGMRNSNGFQVLNWITYLLRFAPSTFPRTWNIHLFESHIATHKLFCTCIY